MNGPKRLTSVLHHPKPMSSGNSLKRAHGGGIAKDMHRKQRPSALGDSRLGSPRIEVERDRIDVRKNGPSPLIERHVRRGHKRKRTGDHLIPI